MQCATPNVKSLSSRYLLPSTLLSGWIIVGSQQWPSEGNPSQEQLCLCYMCYYTPLVLLYTFDVLRTEGNLLRRGCIFAMCSNTPVMCYVLICNVQCGIYCRGCMFAMCSYTPANLRCALYYVLYAVCRGEWIYCAGAASEIDFAIIFNGVITTGYLLDAQQQMDIVKKWNLPMMAAAVFFLLR